MASDQPSNDSEPPLRQSFPAADNEVHSPLVSDEMPIQTTDESASQPETLCLPKHDTGAPGQKSIPGILSDERLGHAWDLHEKAACEQAKTAASASPTGRPDESVSVQSPEKQLDRGNGAPPEKTTGKTAKHKMHGSSQRVVPPWHTHPLFPPLPQYGPPSPRRNARSFAYRVSSFCLSLAFLGVIVLSALVASLPGALRRVAYFATLRDVDARRLLYAEEKRRKQLRRDMDHSWRRRRLSETEAQRARPQPGQDSEDPAGAGVGDSTYTPTAGGPDPLVPDVAHYARRVGLDVEAYEVQTEDGFIIDLWHVLDPNEDTLRPAEARKHRGPGLLFDETTAAERAAAERAMLDEQGGRQQQPRRRPKLPVLLVHGLLQSAGAYCVSDDDSLAFYLCKSGYDVWLGNNRCGFRPRHATLRPSDPRMWCWNIREMGIFDLPALASRVLRETRFARLGLVCHSQGTTEALVALAKEQRPALGEALTVFCALAPAAYAGPLVGKPYFKFLRVLSPAMFRVLFGIRAFIPLMMQVHPLLPGALYGWLGYRVLAFLFKWSDARWDRGLRDRMFQFSPVYVSAESMRWWLGREGFARHKCILATKEQWRREEADDAAVAAADAAAETEAETETDRANGSAAPRARHRLPGATAWYDARVPPFALWVCGRDDLVDGMRLLRRLLPRPVFAALCRGQGNRSAAGGRLRGTREPHVRVVHAKVLPAYEHLDVIWAMDAVDEVFCEIREVLWKTCGLQASCRVPRGCEGVQAWEDPARQWKQEEDTGGSGAAAVASGSSETDAA